MNSFNDIYGKTEEEFYYGTEPTKELEAFLNENHPPVGEALDIGSGEGRNTLLLARYGYHVHTVDSSSEGLHKLERYARSKNINNIKYSIADARTIQFEPNFYDAIVAVTLLDHMNEEEGRRVATSLLMALKTGGFIFIEAFTKQDPGAKATTQSERTEAISETALFVKHYFEENELASWFSELKISLYEEIMKYDESHGEPHYHGVARLIGVKPMDTYYKLERYEEALTDYTQVIELGTEEAWFYNRRGDIYFKLKRYEEALTDYSRTIELDPEKTWFYNDRAKAYIALKRYEEALTDYSRAIELDPGEAWFYYDRANAYIALEKHKDDTNQL